MNEISNYFRPIALTLFAQLLVEFLRMRKEKLPMGSFIICSLALVFMDLFATLFIWTASFSDFPRENMGNGLMLSLAGALACVGFFPSYFRLILLHWKEIRNGQKPTVYMQGLPTVALLFIFLKHSKRVFEVGVMLYNAS